MPLAATLAVLLGAVLHASWNAIVRGGRDRFLDAAMIMSGGIVAALLTLPFVPSPAAACWPYLAASVAIHVLYFSLVALAYRGGEMSLVYPLMRGSAPAITALVAVAVMHEVPSWRGWAGVFLVSAGVLMLAADARRSEIKHPFAPIAFALLNACVIVVYTIVDGIGVRLSANAWSYTAWMFLLTGLIFLAGVTIIRGRQIAAHFRTHWWQGLLGGSCSLTSYALALWAMTYVPIALVAALRETSIVFGAVIAAVKLKERLSPARWVAIVIVVVGAIAIAVKTGAK